MMLLRTIALHAPWHTLQVDLIWHATIFLGCVYVGREIGREVKKDGRAI